MKTCILVFLTFLNIQIFGQSPPEYDKNWDTQNLKFRTIFNNNNYLINWNKDIHWFYETDDFQYTSDNVYLENDYLVLRSQKNPNYKEGDRYPLPPPLYSGEISTKRSDFLYGYYEIECDIDINGTRTMPAFWLVNSQCDLTPKWYEEIDIFEILGETYLWSSNIHVHPCNWNLDWSNYLDDTRITNLSAGFHKYGLEWQPNLLIFYVDNIPVRIIKDTRVPSHGLRLVAQIGFRGVRYTNYPLNNNYMKIKAVNAYNLKMNNCSSDVSLTTQSQFDSFQFGVMRNISIGNGANSITIANNNKVTFRATNDITINGEFTCPLGSELNILNTTCY
jgi:beta-glucanase (GH16 family)